MGLALDTFDQESGIHPRNKQLASKRLAYAGLNVAYNLDFPTNGPYPEVVDFDMLTYKDIKILTNYLSEQGKILPRRVTGLSSKQQKKVTKLIKTARIAALLPFVIGKS